VAASPSRLRPFFVRRSCHWRVRGPWLRRWHRICVRRVRWRRRVFPSRSSVRRIPPGRLVRVHHCDWIPRRVPSPRIRRHVLHHRHAPYNGGVCHPRIRVRRLRSLVRPTPLEPRHGGDAHGDRPDFRDGVCSPIKRGGAQGGWLPRVEPVTVDGGALPRHGCPQLGTNDVSSRGHSYKHRSLRWRRHW
jgi:hypothetical protein